MHARTATCHDDDDDDDDDDVEDKEEEDEETTSTTSPSELLEIRDKNVLPSKPIVARTVYALLHHLTMHVSRSRVSTFPPKFVQQFCIYFRYYILHPFRASR